MTTEQEAVELEQEAAAIQARARNLGWVPKEEWRGEEGKWRDAEEFIDIGERVTPILRQNVKRLSTQLDSVTGKLDRLAEHHKGTSERAYKKALKDLREELLAAVDDGDKNKFIEIDGKIEALRKEEAGPEGSDKQAPAFEAWKGENDWYGVDMEMTAYSDTIGPTVAAHNPKLPPAEVYAKVTEEIKKKFPDYFTNKRRGNAAAVETDTGAADLGGAGKTYNDLPAEAKKICAALVKDGTLTQKQYVKDYYAEEE